MNLEFKKLFLAIILLQNSYIFCIELVAQPRIAIIGAGFAGLTAAYRLQTSWLNQNSDKKGCYSNITIYEARNRVGGRVFTINMNGSPVEMGGLNIGDAGSAVNLKKLIADLGLEIETEHRRSALNYWDGSHVVPHLKQRVREELEALQKKYDFSFEENTANLQKKLEECAESKGPATTLRDVFKKFFGNEKSLLFKMLSCSIAADAGASIEKLNSNLAMTLYGNLCQAAELCLEDEDETEDITLPESVIMVKRGNGKLAEAIAEKFPGQVHLQHVLTQLSKNQDGSYLLIFKNGKTVTADIVVLSMPCPTYKNIEIDEAILSRERKERIQTITYGTNAKIVIPVAEQDPNKDYMMDHGELGKNRGNVVDFYYTGNAGIFTSDTLDATYQRDLPLLKSAYTILQGRLKPVMARDKSFATYNGPVGHSWASDPFAGGSYSCVAPGKEGELFTERVDLVDGSVTVNEQIKKLFAPIADTVFFAGEHTDFGSTMDAAVTSGERAAYLIDHLYMKLEWTSSATRFKSIVSQLQNDDSEDEE